MKRNLEVQRTCLFTQKRSKSGAKNSTKAGKFQKILKIDLLGISGTVKTSEIDCFRFLCLRAPCELQTVQDKYQDGAGMALFDPPESAFSSESGECLKSTF